MVSGGRKTVACFLISLLVGQEVIQAKRVVESGNFQQSKHAEHLYNEQEQKRNPSVPLPDDQEVEAMWQAENLKCRSKYKMWCAKGAENPIDKSVRQCAKQPLAGDVQMTYKCRVTDDWMLRGTPEKPASWWLTMQVKLLKAKTAKLEEYCGTSNAQRNGWKCHRRLQHILRSVRFIAKASKNDVLGNLTPEQLKEAQDAASFARERIGEVIAPGKRDQLNRLMEALIKDEHSFKQNPKAAIARNLKVIQDDILSDDADPTVAEKNIQQMEREARPADPEDEESFKARVKELQDEMAKLPSDADHTYDDTIHNLEKGIELEGEEVMGNRSSLMQLGPPKSTFMTPKSSVASAGLKLVGLMAYAVTMIVCVGSSGHWAFLIPPLYVGVLIAYTVAGMLGCVTVMTAGEMNDPNLGQSDFVWWLGCTITWVTFPFRLVMRTMYWTGRKFFSSKTRSTSEHTSSRPIFSDGPEGMIDEEIHLLKEQVKGLEAEKQQIQQQQQHLQEQQRRQQESDQRAALQAKMKRLRKKRG